MAVFFIDGNFSVQINQIPGTAKGVDHAGVQETKNWWKIQGGLIGITRREISRNNFFLILHMIRRLRKN